MGNRSIGSLLMWAFPQGPQRCVEGHRDEVGRHAVRDRVQRLTQVAPYVRYGVHLTQLKAVPDRLRDLGRGDLLVARLVGDGVDERDRSADPLRRGAAGERAAVIRRQVFGARPRPDARAPRRCWSWSRQGRLRAPGGWLAARTAAWRRG